MYMVHMMYMVMNTNINNTLILIDNNSNNRLHVGYVRQCLSHE